MRDITAKPPTLRESTAEARVVMPPSGIARIREGLVDKGDPLEASRLTALMGVKRTWDLLPYCHPIAVTGIDVTIDVNDDAVVIRVTARGIEPTGMELEAMTGASLAALNLYDMMKPHEKDVHLEHVRLVEKSGGKSDWRTTLDPPVKAAVVVVSDAVHGGHKEDRAGRLLRERLQAEPSVELTTSEVLPDDPDALRSLVTGLVEGGVELVITAGGTGLTSTDRTIEALEPLLEREIPGLMETARAYGQSRTRHAMLSRGIAGVFQGALILAFPGSTGGAAETYDALFPPVLHVFRSLRWTPPA